MPDRSYRDAPLARPNPIGTFSYYGGKSKIAAKYPAPRHSVIIEPFGGSAAYAWTHRHGRSVWVNDLNPYTYGIWQFLQQSDVSAWLDELPDTIYLGQPISSIVPCDAGYGLIALVRAELSRGTAGRAEEPKRATAFGALYYWPRFKARFRLIAQEIRNWRITNLPYEELVPPETDATWFVDPPYSGNAGQRYRHQVRDYAALADWCQARAGQVIVCEKIGANWLPFQPLLAKHIGRHSQHTHRGEVVWHSHDLPLF